MSGAFDVAIVGGGPGGSSTALSLRTIAPELSVAVIEASAYENPRIGEALPPIARSILETLSVWQSFQDQNHREVYGTTSIWGGAVLLDNDFIYMTAGAGWHLDRAQFDRMLAEQAEARGATFIPRQRVAELRRTADEWELTLKTGKRISARFIVDATGGAAAMARRLGGRLLASDHLIGMHGFFEGGAGDPRSLVEAFDNGWWYTAGLTGGSRVAVCMTDADLARRMRLNRKNEWLRCLSAAPMVKRVLAGASLQGQLRVRSARTQHLESAVGEGWLAVGDSASRFDPLSSQGIVKAMRSGIFASYAIKDLLVKNDLVGLRRYDRFLVNEFESYLSVRQKYYAREQRWPASEFWARRTAASPGGKPYTSIISSSEIRPTDFSTKKIQNYGSMCGPGEIGQLRHSVREREAPRGDDDRRRIP